MTKNIDAVLSRGERIELLVDKTDGLSTQARQFRKRATVVRRRMWWKVGRVRQGGLVREGGTDPSGEGGNLQNTKLTMLIGLVIIVSAERSIALDWLDGNAADDGSCTLQLIVYVLVANQCGLSMSHCSD